MKIKNQQIQTLQSILKYPVISDKSTGYFRIEYNKYTFMVDRRADKGIIKTAVSLLFDVTVSNVNTLNVPLDKRVVGRFSGYKTKYKKAIITLKEGDTLDLFPDR